MKIWQKTLLAPLVALIGLGAIGYALVKISAAKDVLHSTFAQQSKMLAALGAQRLALAKRHSDAQMLVFASNKMEKEDRESELGKLSNSLTRFVEFLREDLTGLTLSENEESLLKEIETAVAAYAGEVKGAVEMGAIDAALGLDGITKANRIQSQAADSLQALNASLEARGRELQTAAIESTTKQIQIAGIAAAITLVFLILLSVFTARQIVKPLAELAAVARRVASGDLDGAISTDRRDETGDVLRAFADVKHRLSEFEQAQLAMAAAHAAGDTDHRIDTAALPGTYGTLAGKVNELVDAQFALQQQFIAVMNDYARGELATRMPELPGKKAEITAAARGVQHALSSVSTEIDQLVAAASAGDFSARGDARAYEAQFAKMVGGLNDLMATCEAGLTDANRVFAALARGDLSARIDAEYGGMFGQMKDNANQSMLSLTELIGRIREASESVDTASAEIARGNTDLSARTESQAASLEETTASIEELTGTVAQNADSAQQASSLAANASAIATRGGETVRKVVHTMGSISASSKRIQDIIAVIDGIAFQTNILALNAAVEAARAGEQGRGFAVVASEVRNLAQRSAAAAKEIKGLITESAEQVDAGTGLVNAAGSQMEEIVRAVKQVTDIIAEIAAASAEQHRGIEQVNQAVATMDTTTQQNAALVEEASAAAEAMRSQAQELARAVGEFQSQVDEPYRVAA